MKNTVKITAEDNSVLMVSDVDGILVVTENADDSITIDKSQAEELAEVLNKFISGEPIGK